MSTKFLSSESVGVQFGVKGDKIYRSIESLVVVYYSTTLRLRYLCILKIFCQKQSCSLLFILAKLTVDYEFYLTYKFTLILSILANR